MLKTCCIKLLYVRSDSVFKRDFFLHYYSLNFTSSSLLFPWGATKIFRVDRIQGFALIFIVCSEHDDWLAHLSNEIRFFFYCYFGGQEDGHDGEVRQGRQQPDSLRRPPDPNNPMEYCSRVPPPQQAAASAAVPPPTVMVPVGVLKREGK